MSLIRALSLRSSLSLFFSVHRAVYAALLIADQFANVSLTNVYTQHAQVRVQAEPPCPPPRLLLTGGISRIAIRGLKGYHKIVKRTPAFYVVRIGDKEVSVLRESAIPLRSAAPLETSLAAGSICTSETQRASGEDGTTPLTSDPPAHVAEAWGVDTREDESDV